MRELPGREPDAAADVPPDAVADAGLDDVLDAWPDDVPEWAVAEEGVVGWVAPVPDDVDLVTEVAGLMAVFAAQRLERVDSLRRNALADAGRYGGGVAAVVERSVRLELAAALRVTEHAAGMLLAHAEAMVHRYPAALESLGRAGMTERHAQILVDLLDAAPVEVRERVAGQAVALAEELPVGSFRRALRRLLETEQSATLTHRHQVALGQRRVLIEPAADGMAWLHAFLPAVEAHAIHGRMTAIANTLTGRHARADATDVTGDSVSGGGGGGGAGAGASAGGEGEVDAFGRTGATPGEPDPPEVVRSLDQARADVLADLLIEGDTTAHPAASRGIRATVAVTVPALALLADDDAHRHQQGHAPATVEGLGPVPLDVARELCGGADGWMRILTHPETGMVLSVGRTRYRPPTALARLIRWRADRCMAPGCHIPAARCQIDHNIAWHDGGPTSLNNHTPLCQGHHTVKHHGGWTIQHLPGGALLWTSPTGRHYLVKPQHPVPHFTPTPAHDAATDAPF